MPVSRPEAATPYPQHRPNVGTYGAGDRPGSLRPVRRSPAAQHPPQRPIPGPGRRNMGTDKQDSRRRSSSWCRRRRTLRPGSEARGAGGVLAGPSHAYRRRQDPAGRAVSLGAAIELAITVMVITCCALHPDLGVACMRADQVRLSAWEVAKSWWMKRSTKIRIFRQGDSMLFYLPRCRYLSRPACLKPAPKIAVQRRDPGLHPRGSGVGRGRSEHLPGCGGEARRTQAD